MPKHLELEFGSIGEMISMLRYNDQLTVADLQRPIKVKLDIDTSAPLDGTYLHIAGPINAEWLSMEKTNNSVISIPEGDTQKKSFIKRVIGFRRPDQIQKAEQTETTENTESLS